MTLIRDPLTHKINANILEQLEDIMPIRQDGDGNVGTLRLQKNGKVKSGESSTGRFGQWLLKIYDKARGKYVSSTHFTSQNYATRREQFRLQEYIDQVRTISVETYLTNEDNPEEYKAGDYSSLVKKYHHRNEKKIGSHAITRIQFAFLRKAILTRDNETNGAYRNIEDKRNPSLYQ